MAQKQDNMTKQKFKFEWKKRRGKHRCILCGNCIASCPIFPDRPIEFYKSKESLNFSDEIIHDLKKCSGCGMCVKVCPEGMIKIIKEEK